MNYSVQIMGEYIIMRNRVKDNEINHNYGIQSLKIIELIIQNYEKLKAND